MGAERFIEGLRFGGGLPLESGDEMSEIALEIAAPYFELPDVRGNHFRLSGLCHRERAQMLVDRPRDERHPVQCRAAEGHVGISVRVCGAAQYAGRAI
jgi:hypothetical protein